MITVYIFVCSIFGDYSMWENLLTLSKDPNCIQPPRTRVFYREPILDLPPSRALSAVQSKYGSYPRYPPSTQTSTLRYHPTYDLEISIDITLIKLRTQYR